MLGPISQFPKNLKLSILYLVFFLFSSRKKTNRGSRSTKQPNPLPILKALKRGKGIRNRSQTKRSIPAKSETKFKFALFQLFFSPAPKKKDFVFIFLVAVGGQIQRRLAHRIVVGEILVVYFTVYGHEMSRELEC